MNNPTMRPCICKQKCDLALGWAARTPMAQCCADDAECKCWCHEIAAWEQEIDPATGKKRCQRRSIWYMPRQVPVRGGA